jgi:hypothetical protein
MNDIGNAISKKLLAEPSVTAITSTRVWPDTLPKNAVIPAVVYSVISNIPEHHLTGAAAIAQARVQLDCYASTRDAANELGETVRLAIDGQRGTWGSQYIRTCHLDNDLADYDYPIDGSDAKRYLRTQDYLVNYKLDLA